MRIEIPQHVRRILAGLCAGGYEAYAVGGCVRDALLGREPEDWDITTSARPQEIKRLFRRTLDTGIQHGTVTVMQGKVGCEVTTYRLDGKYEDGRHPASVTFTASLTEDLKRRDFTINAMAYNPEEGIVDLFGGMEDLKEGVIRCVGCARERFTEDALRILRAVRFSAQLGFRIEEETREGIVQLAPNLEKVSRERVQVELTKLLCSPHPEYFRILYETGLTRQLFPEFDEMMQTPQNTPYHCYNAGEHTLQVLRGVRPQPYLRWAALLHDCKKPACRRTDEAGRDHFKGHEVLGAERGVQLLKELRFDNDTMRAVERLIFWHDERFEQGKPAIRRCLGAIGEELFVLLLELDRADNLAKSPVMRERLLENLERVRRQYEEILADKDPYTLKMLAVTGRDLTGLGVKPGREMGEILQAMLQHVMEEPSDNTRERLLSIWREGALGVQTTRE